MRRGLAGTDAYLEGFDRGESLQMSGTPEEVANLVKDKLEADYESIATSALKRTSG